MESIEDKIELLLNTTKSSLKEWNLGEVDINLDVLTEGISSALSSEIPIDSLKFDELISNLENLKDIYDKKRMTLNSMVNLKVENKNLFTGEGNHQVYVFFKDNEPQSLYQLNYDGHLFANSSKIDIPERISQRSIEYDFRQNSEIDALVTVQLNTEKKLGIENCLLRHVIDRYETQK